MRYSQFLFIGFVCCVVSTVLGSYEHGGYPSTHDYDDDYYEPSYPAPPIVHPHHGGHTAGSYYHYHVPLVGQQQHYQPSYHHQDHSSFLWPLLLLLALPLLFLPLLPLLLLPLGISLLALLAPGGMMMMMMMMMMMGGGMMMRSDTISGRAFNEMRTFGDVIYMDMTSLLSKYARSFDLDQCPQRIACEMGAVFFPEHNSTDTAKAFTSFVMEQYLPKGAIKKSIRTFEKAFWTGSANVKSCSAFQCRPTFKIYNNEKNGKDPAREATGAGSNSWKSGSSSSPFSFASPTNPIHFNGTTSYSNTKTSQFVSKKKPVNYIYPNIDSGSKANVDIDSTVNANNRITQDGGEESMRKNKQPKVKTKRSHYSHNSNDAYNQAQSSPQIVPYGKYNLEDVPSFNKQTSLYKMFGTPTIKS